MSYETILLNKEDGVAVITLNRPPMNPLNSKVYSELAQAADELQADDSVKAVIITGAGSKAFAAGADVAEMATLTPVEVYQFCQGSKTCVDKIENLGKPVIAAIRGFTFGGGCELTLACDYRLAADNAKFSLPETGLGIIPGNGATQRLPRLIGAAKAKELIFLGDIIDAASAEKIGLVNKVVSIDTLLEEAKAVAKRMAGKPTVAIKMAKEAINTGSNVDIHAGLAFEIQAFVTAFASADAKEGLGAFLEKRKPNYTGK
ncbi:enoyl-CoA hydratase/isomerase family protein [Desulfotomaculum sp. 1211_IL3151]|uniref:enoyl-CoA hydratase/isomerase family protein n=1 Tax=Desulfotomaculum sp. 1211_IL3151 TaxID=3084055 RepID=UPI002FDB6D30